MSDRIDRLRRRYAALTVPERVDLLLAAEERSDLWELETLDRSCPSADLHPYLTRLLALQSAASLVALQLLAGEVLLFARFTRPPPDPPAAATPPDPSLESLHARQLALWQGFVAWCRGLGHDPHQVLLLAPLGLDERDPAFFILRQQLARLQACPPDRLPDPHQVQLWSDFFTHAYACADPSSHAAPTRAAGVS